MKRVQTVFFGIVTVVIVGLLAGCGGGVSGTVAAEGVSSSATATKLSQLPSFNTLTQTSTSSNLAVGKSLAKTVSGTPPLLNTISADNVDTYFWNGLLATLKNASTVTTDQEAAFWQGSGACWMAQSVGYSFQDVLSAGTALCYMKNAPSLASGVTVTGSTAAEMFTTAAATKTIKVTASSVPSDDGKSTKEENIFIKVYGSSTAEGSAGYAADLWFCNAGSVQGYQKIRIDASNVLTSTDVDVGSDGSFVGLVTATLKASGDALIFDPTKSREAKVYFKQDKTGDAFTFLNTTTLGDGTLTSRSYETSTFNGATSANKNAIYAQYSGNTMSALRFLAAGVAGINTFSGSSNATTEAVEYKNAYYAPIYSGDLYTSAKAEPFTDAVYSGTTTTYTDLLSAKSDFSCSATADITATMDFTDTAVAALAKTCESDFKDMNFCQSDAINTVQGKIQSALSSCQTSSCTYNSDIHDDFSCQRWAEKNSGNAQGLTTANAVCSSNGCCTK